MSTLHDFSEEFNKLVLGRWGGIQKQLLFTPGLHEKEADLISDCPFELAAKLRQDPLGLAEYLADLANQRIGLGFSAQFGYLHYCGPSTPEWLLNPIASGDLPEHSRYLILLPPATEGCCGWAYLRLAALALFQAWALHSLGCGVKVAVAGQFSETLTASIRGADLMRSLLSTALLVNSATPAAVGQILAEVLDNSSIAASNVWLASDSLPLSALRKLTDRTNLKVWYAKGNWLHGLASLDDYCCFFELDDSELLGLFAYLAGGANAPELDPGIIRYQESANLSWLHAAVQKRYDLVLKESCHARDSCWLGLPGDLERRLAIRSKFLRCYWELAGLVGAVTSFVTILNETLQLVTRLSNQPGLREVGADNGGTGRSKQIISSGICELSDIMNSMTELVK